MIKRIHVNQHHIKANNKGADLPVFTIKTYKDNIKGNEVTINGTCKVVYKPDSPLSCGARVWIETNADVVIKTDNGEVVK